MKILFLSNEPYAPQAGSTNRQRLARAAVNDGHEVLYLETLGWSFSRRKTSKKGERTDDELPVIRAKNVLPWGGRAWNLLGRGMNQAITIRDLPDDFDVVVVHDPFWGRVARRCAPRAKIVYDCLDAYEFQPQFASRVERFFFRQLERRTARASDLRCASSAELAADRATRWVVPVAVALGAHEFDLAIEQDSWLQRWRSTGTDDERAQVSLLISALDAYKVDLTPIANWLAGDSARRLRLYGFVVGVSDPLLTELLASGQVDHRGPLSSSDLLEASAGCSFAWVTLRQNDYSRFSFPLKVWDYLFAGLPVVALHAPALSKIPGVLSLRPDQPVTTLELRRFRNRTSASRVWEALVDHSARARWRRLSV